jgi:flotillin
VNALSAIVLGAGPVEAILTLLGIGLLFFVTLGVVISRVLYVCQPNEVLIFSGMRHVGHDGRRRGYRIIRGGRAIRIPLLEAVDRMDLTNMIIEVTVRNAYSKGGIPLSVQGIANIKVPGEEPLLDNTLERFLGKSRAEIMKIARETLEGNLRGVLATLTPEEVNRDKERFATQLTAEAEQDLNRLGLVLDTLKIQNVSDEVGYLDAIGRRRAAEIRRNAQIAEAAAQAEAAEQKWRNTMSAELATLESQIQIAMKDNERRIADARSRREAWIAEQRAAVQAQVAQAQAELAMQDARIEQTRVQLQADVLQPAEASRRQAEERAKADAATVVERGKAGAQVLEEIAQAYKASGSTGREVLLLQKLLPLLQQIAGTIDHLKVDRLTVLGASPTGAAPLAGGLVSLGEQIRAATGVDVARALRERVDPGSSR